VKGGPVFPAGTNIVGTYAGVLQGAFDPTNAGSSNSIGIFSLGVPGAGTAGGRFLMFSRGRVFTGSIQGFADPEKAMLKGILDASFRYNLNVPVTRTTTVNGTVVTTTTIEQVEITASAKGPINAKIANAKSASSFGSVTRIRGDATLSISQGQVDANLDPTINRTLSLVVSGVKQSNEVAIAAPLDSE
jgi:hypothetical protein